MLVDSGNEAENEPEQPLNSEIGTTPTILVPDILVSIQELLQRQTELMNSWEIFRSEQVVREAVFTTHVEHILRELTEARNTHNLICQTLQNQFAYTSPIIYTMGTVMCNIANTMRSSDIPSFFPHFTVSGGGCLNVTGANLYQGTHVFVPTPFPTTTMDINRGSGTTASPMTFSSQPLSVFSKLEANHGVATTGGSSVPIQQENGFDVNTYLDLFQGNGHEN
uniref:Uncharacterized protein LOC104221925 isoform X1 n=1 Tax=Nicotiana sylvestris TaxID=4096 RepID=A0A1U7W2E9_NICSY|nr:PREDICTED: uncharacterized protein LOC104221925 isoform X1 [Nicotiana sylvestris]XP_009771381.1 PREDICTED: uncharacterized protein LOC104221925 isoform X1 [Nicotiana sylvestris]